MLSAEEQYFNLYRRICCEGYWVYNERTGKRVLTVIDADMCYDMRRYEMPILTTKKVAWKSAIAEFLGYLYGYSNAEDFRQLGCKTWDANANENEAWLENPERKGEDDMGRVYGVQWRSWRRAYDNSPIDQLKNVYSDLRRGADNRREIITAWNPGEEHLMCLPACIHTHTFSLLNGELHLTSYQRSADMMLGVPFNMVQLGFFLLFMARITGHQPGFVYHKIVNAHIYEDQLSIFEEEQEINEMFPPPLVRLHPDLHRLNDLDWFLPRHVQLINYEHGPVVNYPFSV